jgi:hypothetical protein
MTPVPEPAEWILRALTHRRGSENFTAPAREPPERSNLRSILKQALLPLYRPIRPFVRPPLWRLRAFMTGPFATERQAERDLLAGLTAKLGALGADIHRISSMQAQLREELDQMRDELNSELELIQDQFAKNMSSDGTQNSGATIEAK